MALPPPTRDELRDLLAQAMRRGVPRQDAEDLVHAAWERAGATWNPARGPHMVLLRSAVAHDAVDWWRRHVRRQAVLRRHAPPDDPGLDPGDEARAAENQRRLLEALDDDERRVFAVWALQKHLPQGTLTATRAAETLGCSVAEYNNAKRRLRDRIHAILGELGWAPRELYSVGPDEGPRRHHASHR